MGRTGVEPSRWDVRWTGEDLAESYEELAEIEPRVEREEREPSPGRDRLGLLTTLEGRERAEAPPPQQPPAAPAAAPEQEAETYAVLPELELLVAIAEYGRRAEAARDDARDEPAPEPSTVAC